MFFGCGQETVAGRGWDRRVGGRQGFGKGRGRGNDNGEKVFAKDLDTDLEKYHMEAMQINRELCPIFNPVIRAWLCAFVCSGDFGASSRPSLFCAVIGVVLAIRWFYDEASLEDQM
ncbi:hypothetical protein RHGRI_007609 [Rhododendron griersonianum]|uniref:Uncharacterized protein n=1 Tax=Rhododendron griersonianum TaxID=479676 RepID=A0AAV6KXP9_9ERIC|nr:hypothetical protein RHGRI_007609 [Rhododendron griersonianum]